MTLPVTVESVDLATRDAAITSLHELLGDRLSTARWCASSMGKMHPIIPAYRRMPSPLPNRPRR